MATRKRKSPPNKTKNRMKEYLHEISHSDYHFVGPLAKKIHEQSAIVAKYISYVVAEIAVDPFSKHNTDFSSLEMVSALARIIFPQANETVNQIEETLDSVRESLGELSLDFLKKTEVTSEILTSFIDIVCLTLETNPQLIALFNHPLFLKEALGPLGEKISGVLNLLPAMSNQATEKFPQLKEIFFQALFQLTHEERVNLYSLAELVMGDVYRLRVFPMLNKTLMEDERGRVLSPILLGAIDALPGESCINTLLSIACTPHNEISNARVIAIAIQEMGGLYIKIAQVIAELCPPSLARELKTSQDDAGGLYPSIEKSWTYFVKTMQEPVYDEFRSYMILPKKPIRHFASASMGSLYFIELNQNGKAKFNVQNILVKIQRPHLKELFDKQCAHILTLTDKAHKLIIEDKNHSEQVTGELLGLISALRRSILNYHKQSLEELDFTIEEKNVDKVRAALGDNHAIKVPHFFFSTEKAVFMECINGIKVTRMIQTKYLERKEIADSIAAAYIDLVFNKGVVWADPHPGNILYSYEDSQISMIDLNPCFVWDVKTREEFKHLIYRLVLRDGEGVYRTLNYLVENPESLNSEHLLRDLNSFLHNPLSISSLTRFVGEFMKTLSENQVDLKIEVQAALRGLSQIALTTSAISVRNSFGSILRKQFILKELLGTVWNVGVFRVLKVVFSTVFEFIRSMPDEDIGPVLDERDIASIFQRTRELAKANVCNVTLKRVSPEDHPDLKMSQDGQTLLITSNLYMDILDKVRPARVRYKIEIPSRKWLKDRQEFVKLASIARSFCTIESLEQLRRNSLDDYWKIVEAWGKPISDRSLLETQLVAEVNIAARNLYSLRFEDIWKSNYTSLSWSARMAWKWLLTIELWRETSKQNYFISQKKYGGELLRNNVFSKTYYRTSILILEGFLWVVKKKLNSLRFSMHLLPISSLQLEDLVLFGLSRNFNHTFKN